MPQLNNPREEALTAVFSPVANKTVAVKPRLADTLNAPRSHQLRMGKDIVEKISQGSINEQKIVEGER